MKNILYFCGALVIVSAIVYFAETWPLGCLICWGLLAAYFCAGCVIFKV